MKCPKCGYNSFEFLELCKKCGADFASFKKSMGIKPLVFVSGATAMNAQQQFAEDAAVMTSPAADNESFTWDGPTPGTTAEGDKPFDGFDLEFIKTDTPRAVPDYTFNEVPEKDLPTATEDSAMEAFEGFSFEEPDVTVLEPEEPPVIAAFEQEFLGAEDMDLAEAPENSYFGETGVKGELAIEEIIAPDLESLEIDASEPIFELEELPDEEEMKHDKIAKPAKDISAGILDFDKEFDAIFTEDSPETKE
jgi:hypothetical protein